MKVPFPDLKSHHANLRAEINGAIQDVIDAAAFAGGLFVNRFEADSAAYCDSPHAIGVGSGTEALWLTLLALGIGQGDEVITVPNTFMATAEAITHTGAEVVFRCGRAELHTGSSSNLLVPMDSATWRTRSELV